MNSSLLQISELNTTMSLASALILTALFYSQLKRHIGEAMLMTHYGLQTFLQSVFCSHQTRSLLLVLSLWLSSRELWLGGIYSKLSKSEEENSCHQQKRK